jgi:hydroxymethylpyrimidine pyrophosphatase-like HAD family hydrolase
VKPLDALDPGEARRLDGVVFDLDDTVLDHGVLGEDAYRALFRLRASGLRLLACTGRPAGWGEVLVRQWPLDAVVVENGAVAFVVEPSAVSDAPGAGAARRIAAVDPLPSPERRARRAALLALADEILGRFPETALADDNDARRTDVTLDIGEHRRVDVQVIRAIAAMARSRGVRTLVSSIHLHLSRETDDKATGTIRVLVHHFGEDATRARARFAFVGDSANDAAAFAAFALTFGVANVRAHLRGLTVPPRYVAPAPMGAGFAAVAARICALRESGA